MYEAKISITFTKPITKEHVQILLELAGPLKEKGEITGHDVEGSTFTATVGGERTITDFIVPLEKQAREQFGKRFKIGVKEATLPEYTITENMDQTPAKEVRIPFVHDIRFDGKMVTLEYRNAPLKWVKDHYVEKSIKLIREKVWMHRYAGKEEYREYVWEGKERQVTYTGDPAEDLEKMHWIKRTEAKGQFVYGREFTALMQIMKDLFVEHVFRPLEFFEATFPKFEPWSIPKKSGHAKNIYPMAYFVSVPKNSSDEYWEDIKDHYAITGEIPIDDVVERITCAGLLSYAQCPPFWPYLENKTIDEGTLPLLVYDWSGPTYRNEAGGTHGLDRIEEFHRTEILFVGTKEHVVDIWQKLKDALTKLFDEVLDIEIRVAKVTPWWMAHAGINTASEDSDSGTYDFDAYLPYRGNREREWLEIQNDSSNGDKYPKAFRVRGRKGELLWSGCAGHSLERVIVAFLAQKGVDPAGWPEIVRERFEERTRGMVPLKYH